MDELIFFSFTQYIHMSSQHFGLHLAIIVLRISCRKIGKKSYMNRFDNGKRQVGTVIGAE